MSSLVSPDDNESFPETDDVVDPDGDGVSWNDEPPLMQPRSTYGNLSPIGLGISRDPFGLQQFSDSFCSSLIFAYGLAGKDRFFFIIIIYLF